MENFLYQHGKVLSHPPIRHLIQIHEHGHKRCLPVTGHKGNQLILYGLDSAPDLAFQAAIHDFFHDFRVQGISAGCPLLHNRAAYLLPADIHKRRQMGQGKCLPAVLIAGHLGHNLRGHIAGSKEAVRFFNHCLTDYRSVLKHVLQIDQVAVMLFLCIIIRIMEMNNPLFMGFHDLLRKQHTHGQVLAHLSCHIIPLCGIDHRIFIGILLIDSLVQMINQSKDSVVRGVGLAGQLPLIAVPHIFLGNFITAHLHDAGFHHILYVLHMGNMGHFLDLSFHSIRNRLDLIFIQSVNRLCPHIRGIDGIYDLARVKLHLFPIPLDHLHISISFLQL